MNKIIVDRPLLAIDVLARKSKGVCFVLTRLLMEELCLYRVGGQTVSLS